jgi:2,4-dienoyl-CoA reductase-like NADH-dependent reductase (Old Yellow Enzyme family)
MLKENDVDLIDVSSGGLSPLQKIELKPGYQIHFSQQIKNQSNIPTGGVGLITTATQAEEILTHQQADLIFLGRELLRHPYFPLQAAKELNCHVEWPLQYARARL